jgi:hypothetical protein
LDIDYPTSGHICARRAWHRACPVAGCRHAEWRELRDVKFEYRSSRWRDARLPTPDFELTPAMAGGWTDHVWEVEEIVGLIR